jgi:hypothetical protein
VRALAAGELASVVRKGEARWPPGHHASFGNAVAQVQPGPTVGNPTRSVVSRGPQVAHGVVFLSRRGDSGPIPAMRHSMPPIARPVRALRLQTEFIPQHPDNKWFVKLHLASCLHRPQSVPGRAGPLPIWPIHFFISPHPYPPTRKGAAVKRIL